MAELSEFSLHPGDAAPEFDLPATDGRRYRRADFDGTKFLVVTFWCNHCPYVLGWESRMIDIARAYTPKGVGFVLINANDAKAYPDDRFERMAQRAKEKGYPMPYLHDESQAVAHAYGALVTPHPMLFGPDRTLLFQGRIDDRHDRPDLVRERYLAPALDAAIAGRAIPVPELPVQGCSVKWRA